MVYPHRLACVLCLKIILRIMHRLNDCCSNVVRNEGLGRLWGIGLNILFLRVVQNMSEVLYQSGLCVFATGVSYAMVRSGNGGRKLILGVQ